MSDKLTPTQVLRDQITTTQALLVRAEQENAALKVELSQRRQDVANARAANDKFHAVRSDVLGLKHVLLSVTEKASEVFDKLEKALKE